VWCDGFSTRVTHPRVLILLFFPLTPSHSYAMPSREGAHSCLLIFHPPSLVARRRFPLHARGPHFPLFSPIWVPSFKLTPSPFSKFDESCHLTPLRSGISVHGYLTQTLFVCLVPPRCHFFYQGVGNSTPVRGTATLTIPRIL